MVLECASPKMLDLSTRENIANALGARLPSDAIQNQGSDKRWTDNCEGDELYDSCLTHTLALQYSRWITLLIVASFPAGAGIKESEVAILETIRGDSLEKV